MRIAFFGDIHAEPHDMLYADAIGVHYECGGIFVVGDFGYRFDDHFLDATTACKLPVTFIRGNHDDTTWLREACGKPDREIYGGGVEQVWDNLYWYPDLTSLTIGDKVFGFQGGGYSIDEGRRSLGLSLWADEFPTDAGAVGHELEQVDADYLITHDIPDRFWPLLKTHFPPLPDPKVNMKAIRSRQLVDSAYEFFGCPKRIVHGHYHFEQVTDTVISLQCNARPGWVTIYDSEADEFTFPNWHSDLLDIDLE